MARAFFAETTLARRAVVGIISMTCRQSKLTSTTEDDGCVMGTEILAVGDRVVHGNGHFSPTRQPRSSWILQTRWLFSLRMAFLLTLILLRTKASLEAMLFGITTSLAA